MPQITKRTFGQTVEGRDIFIFRMEGTGGAYIEVMNYGAAWLKAFVPDKNGTLTDVCLSYDALDEYVSDKMFIGASVGRYANRIKGAAFMLNEITYSLQKNDGENSLHGGFDGYGKRIWDYEVLDDAVAFHLHSADGDQGYPGSLDVTVTYTFGKDNTLAVDYLAVSDRDTPVNLTNHAYFNLAGASSGEAGAMAQTLRINAESITEIDDAYLPTGRLLPVESTPLDFRKETVIGVRLGANHPQMRVAGGYDVNFAVDGSGLREAAILTCPQNGVTMRLLITNPGLQFYSGNMIGPPFVRHSAVCLEPQHYPDSVHHTHFPSSILKVGKRYEERTEYQFSVT